MDMPLKLSKFIPATRAMHQVSNLKIFIDTKYTGLNIHKTSKRPELASGSEA
jgi:hypothetical protein